MTIDRPSDRLFRYPPMERQDLNQSQLGSFKFTPVDNVGSLQAIATSYMSSQINAYLARIKASSSPSDRPHHPAGIVNADFFNKHIKPDLGDSRLRLGPAAVRSAVEGATTSPTRQGHILQNQMKSDRLSTSQSGASSAAPSHNPGWSPLIQSTVSHYRTPFSTNHQSDEPTPSGYGCTTIARSKPENSHPATFSMSQAEASSFLPNNSPFSPANPREMPIGFPDPALVNQSLSLALLTEQHVHELTRATLREQIENNLRLQAELDHSNERIRKLQMRMKLMNDVPNNYSNTNFESGSTRVPDRNDSNKAVRVAVGQDNNEGTARGDGVNPYEDKGCLKPATAANGSAEVADAVNHLINDGPESELDDSKLFDLGILEGSALEGTLCSHARQTLRKHFVVDSHQETITATPVQQCSNKLIEVSPESISSESGPVAPRVNKLLSLFQVPSTSTNPGPESTTTMTSYDDIKNLRTSDNPVLEWPAAFLAKYSTKPSVKEEDGLQDDFYSFDNGNMTEGASKTNDEGNGSEDQDGLTDLKTPATTSATESPTFIGEIPAEFPGQPMWKIHKDNPIFHDNSEKERAKHFSGIPLDPSSQFYNHPVRYLPENGVKSEDTFRTVMIDHIPLGTCANEVLHIIRGGAVESIEMVGPIGKATDYMTARVVFILEDSAMAMAKLQDLEINRVKLYCWLVREPTYPRSGDMEEFVTGGLDATRILWINNLKPAQYTQIQGVIMGLGLGRQLIGLDWGWESRAVLEFTSIKAAVKAAKCILKHPVYADATISFDEDYTSKE